MCSWPPCDAFLPASICRHQYFFTGVEKIRLQIKLFDKTSQRIAVGFESSGIQYVLDGAPVCNETPRDKDGPMAIKMVTFCTHQRDASHRCDCLKLGDGA